MMHLVLCVYDREAKSTDNSDWFLKISRIQMLPVVFLSVVLRWTSLSFLCDTNKTMQTNIPDYFFALYVLNVGVVFRNFFLSYLHIKF